MPSRTFIDREEKSTSGFKASKVSLTPLLGTNAPGDFKPTVNQLYFNFLKLIN